MKNMMLGLGSDHDGPLCPAHPEQQGRREVIEYLTEIMYSGSDPSY